MNSHSDNAKNRCENFLKISKEFSLGHLTTESRHPLTMHLSTLIQKNIKDAIALMQKVDAQALEKLTYKTKDIFYLHQAIKNTLQKKNKIFLCGCGATGRLSLALETLWHQIHPQAPHDVVSFMAGGDVALIKSIENFEDHPEYGEKQLMELGFRDGDLLLAITEGGETPFVIGAALKAAAISKNSPFFLYCNPNEELINLKRCHEVITNQHIHKMNLTVGPMAISGSTRMQASTVLMMAAGLGLLYQFKTQDELEAEFNKIKKLIVETDLKQLATFIETESAHYESGNGLVYEVDQALALSILTDTTERSPTFSLLPFENFSDVKPDYSLCYLSLRGTHEVSDAWKKLLYRHPRCLTWEHSLDRTSLARLMGFDISEKCIEKRKEHFKNLVIFDITQSDHSLRLKLDTHELNIPTHGATPLGLHLLLKTVLNIHSTLVMGKLNRYSGNIMTWVKPTNNKLIDRSARYIQHLLTDQGMTKSYEQVLEQLFIEMEQLKEGESVVLKTLEHIKAQTNI